ncbi:GNAT family N-acetyltransferase [Roseateles amylovorans]|uniref:GNAT family N-acetyltransferase n=1 Tax=Roseateles amylovorans TaxID=2978473 RepID=A0ABY6B0W5_9BURK|nr:GNAT family N-acetyltransferase [Roseateles amylovorans]UXH78803.1 GNAT family N-acetyltransferase [Roseateles amylovorans]
MTPVGTGAGDAPPVTPPPAEDVSPRLDDAWTEADLAVVHDVIRRTYWAEDIPLEVMRRAMAGSLNLLMRSHSGDLIGYARVVTDRATFAYLCDVFVLEGRRGQGLGDWMIGQVVAHPALQGLRRFSLFTRDAHALYARHGFTPLATPDRGMEIVRPGLYRSHPPQPPRPN